LVSIVSELRTPGPSDSDPLEEKSRQDWQTGKGAARMKGNRAGYRFNERDKGKSANGGFTWLNLQTVACFTL